MWKRFREIGRFVAIAVAFMTGSLSLVREYLLLVRPDKFQESPLFWGCLRVSFALAMVVLYAEERRKRLELEAAKNPVLSLSDNIRSLSVSLLDFAYERSQQTPKLSLPEYGSVDAHSFGRDVRRHSQEARDLRNYEDDTKGIYEYRFKPQIEAAIRQASPANGDYWTRLLDTSSWITPNTIPLIAIGTDLQQLADELDKSITKTS